MNATVTLTAPVEAVTFLENGKVLLLPDGGFALRREERALLNASLLAGAKNISLSPNGDLKHTVASGKDRILLQEMMARFAVFAAELVETIAPTYRGKITRGRTSFRPAEIEGRKTSALQDDSRLHVDAFPTTPMQGRRILRVFANVNPEAARHWHVGEPFEAMAQRFLPKIRPASAAWHLVLAALRITKQRRTAYDDVMLALHNKVKLDQAYQTTCSKEQVAFAPGMVWLCYTDQVMHAALKGQHALEQTFYLPPGAMVDPDKTPLRVLERLIGRTLI